MKIMIPAIARDTIARHTSSIPRPTAGDQIVYRAGAVAMRAVQPIIPVLPQVRGDDRGDRGIKEGRQFVFGVEHFAPQFIASGP